MRTKANAGKGMRVSDIMPAINRSAARFTEAQQKKAEYLYDELGKHFWPVIGTANHSAISTMYEAIDLMESAGMIRQRVKTLVKQINSRHEEYCRATHAAIGERYFLWQDIIARAHGNLSPDIMKLYYSIKQQLDRRGVGQSVILSHAYTATTMLSFSTRMFDEMMKIYQSQTVLDITTSYRGGRLTAIENLWRTATDIITPSLKGGDLKLFEDKNCELAINVIAHRYQSMDFINDASTEAMRLNPDMAKYAAEEDRHFFTGEK